MVIGELSEVGVGRELGVTADNQRVQLKKGVSALEVDGCTRL